MLSTKMSVKQLFELFIVISHANQPRSQALALGTRLPRVYVLGDRCKSLQRKIFKKNSDKFDFKFEFCAQRYHLTLQLTKYKHNTISNYI